MAPHANDTDGSATGIAVEHARESGSTAFTVDSPNVTYTPETVQAKYTYRTTSVDFSNGQYKASPKETKYDFKTERKVGKVGVMLVGWGGVSVATIQHL